MSLFQCDKCGCLDNTACGGNYHLRHRRNEDWYGIPNGVALCCACTPSHTLDGELVNKRAGKWHNEFDRVFLPKGEFFTNNDGNLEHKETGLLSDEFVKEYPERVTIEKGTYDED
jgi:hypothetical protein